MVEMQKICQAIHLHWLTKLTIVQKMCCLMCYRLLVIVSSRANFFDSLYAMSSLYVMCQLPYSYPDDPSLAGDVFPQHLRRFVPNRFATQPSLLGSVDRLVSYVTLTLLQWINDHCDDWLLGCRSLFAITNSVSMQ